ncbi:MAG: carboxylating nicotinate-nucleotide diphosphorylase [candidate division WOR-3 bacterium]
MNKTAKANIIDSISQSAKSAKDVEFGKYGEQIKKSAIEAFKEDAGYGDVTTDALFPQDRASRALVVAEEDCILAGLLEAREILETGGLRVSGKADGTVAKKGDVVLRIFGSVKEILARERIVLNYISKMSGIATLSRKLYKKYGKRVAFLRKTDPGLMFSEKRAVALGGCMPHRMNLSDGILIKDNHLDELAKKGNRVTAIIKALIFADEYRAKHRYMPIEIEVESLREAMIAAGVFVKLRGPNIILLDNMSPKDVKVASHVIKKRCPNTIVEASGGITEKNIGAYLKAGADYVSTSIFASARPCRFKLEISK